MSEETKQPAEETPEEPQEAPQEEAPPASRWRRRSWPPGSWSP